MFKFKIENLKESQRRLKNKKAFKPNIDDYKEYETFILNSLGETKTSYL